MNIVHYCEQNKTDTPAFALFIDAEQAFDCVEWSFMFSVPERIGSGSFFAMG